ncbi:hypothetical protein [Flavobacterium caeni]|uniref:Uncharacterized protein n=1 Tax=Flavobacterium caeni TaxID=490189 RepID=A0A1G5ALJ2_9FLAO|nr:hypothetical protein [Flavobacterium caeni]SCX78776.1 hypothetical protein SAMN02927903_00055 [Flavobacterium caeni]
MKTIAFLLLLSSVVNAQVGINTATPDASSVLDVSATDKGMLIPRVSLVSLSDGTAPILNPAVSTLVYNTNQPMVGGLVRGFYYWNGAVWVRLATQPEDKWTRNPFSGAMSPATPTDWVGIGTASPQQRLDVAGKIRIADGTQGQGRVLVSDANGAGTWTDNVAITPSVIGTFGSGVTVGNGATVGNITANFNSGVSITLPPGKWMIFGTFLMQAYLPYDGSMFVRTMFSCNPTTAVGCDTVIGGLMSGEVSGPSHFSILNGQSVIWNQSGANRTYYLFVNVTKYGNVPTTTTLNAFGSSFWAENMLSAIPMN